MRKKHRQKIKRYRNSLSGKAERGLVVRRVLGFVVFLAVLFGLGWLLAGPAINFASEIWNNIKGSGSSSVSVSAPIESETSSSQPDIDEPDPIPAQPLQSADGNWAYVAFSAIDTAEKAADTAKNLAAQGIACAVINLKDERGYLYYKSSIELAKQQTAERTLDAAQTAQTFLDNGIVPIAGIYAFKDTLAPARERAAAVTYNGQEGFLWLDNSPELGGNPWLNPYSDIAVQYVSDLINEILGFGYKQIIVSGAHYPTGFSLEQAGFALPGDTRTKQQALSDAISNWQSLAAENEAQVWMEYPIEAVLDDNNTLTFASPLSLGSNCVLINFTQSVQRGELENTLNHELFAAAFAKAQSNGNAKLAMTMGSGLLSDQDIYAAASAAKQAGFVSFVVK